MPMDATTNMVADAERSRKFRGKNCKHRGAEAYKHIGPQPGRLAFEFALQADDPTQDGSQSKTDHGL